MADVGNGRRVGYAAGVYDLFHVGHLNILQQARERCDSLIAGVTTDEAVVQTKGYPPVVPYVERAEIVKAITYVDAVIPDSSVDKTLAYRTMPFDIIFKGDDWQGTEKGDNMERDMAALGVEVVYFPYTVHTSSSMLRLTLDRLAKSLQ